VNGRKYSSYEHERKMKIRSKCNSSIAVKGESIGHRVEWIFGRIKKFLIMKLKVSGSDNDEDDPSDDIVVCQVSRFTMVAKDDYTGLYKVSTHPHHKKLIYLAPQLIAKPVVIAPCPSLNNYSLVLDCTC
jgi:hypothetical protein